MKLTSSDIERDLELAARATPGPWQSNGSHIYGPDPRRYMVAVACNEGASEQATPLTNNRDLISRSRTALPDYARDLQEAIELLKWMHATADCCKGVPGQCHTADVLRAFFGESQK